MKKLSSIVVVLFICLLFTSCTIILGSGSASAPVKSNTESIKPAEIESETDVNTPPDIPNAKEFPEFEWPTFGAATKIPKPEWSNCGEILVDSEITFWCQIGYSTLDDYNAYVKACQDAGYVEDYYSVTGYMYYGANVDGYAVQLTYNQYDHYLAIQVTAYASEWDKWWAEETETSTND